MSRVCQLSGKRPASGNSVSYSRRHTKRRFVPNLVVKRINGVKLRIAASTLRTLKKWAREDAAAAAAKQAAAVTEAK